MRLKRMRVQVRPLPFVGPQGGVLEFTKRVLQRSRSRTPCSSKPFQDSPSPNGHKPLLLFPSLPQTSAEENSVHQHGSTPLMQAIRTAQWEAAATLISAGARTSYYIYVRDHQGIG